MDRVDLIAWALTAAAGVWVARALRTALQRPPTQTRIYLDGKAIAHTVGR